MEENKGNGSSFIGFLMKALIIVAACAGVCYYIVTHYGVDAQRQSAVANEIEEEVEKIEEEPVEEQKPVAGQVSGFDISFLKQNLEKENKIYSPLSIKYALKMLEDGSNGNTKAQISKVIGDLDLKPYKNNKNMALANVMFVRNTYKDSIKKDYVDLLKSRYGAALEFDDFTSAKNINKWVNDNTLGILDNLVDDDTVKPLDFALINALAIDLEWNNKFIPPADDYEAFVAEDFGHIIPEKTPENEDLHFFVTSSMDVIEKEFEGPNGNIKVSGMDIKATIDNYDIVSKLGEDNMRATIKEAYTKFMRDENYNDDHIEGYRDPEKGTSDEDIDKALAGYLENYFDEINANYHKVNKSTDFEVYDDNEVKAFAKDLKTVDGVTLQYVSIMPKNLELDTFIKSMTEKDINKYISNLKTLDYNNFDNDCVTIIDGYVPKFDFEYSLDLMEDLKKLNITDVFENGKADLSNMVDGDAYIGAAVHKANIELTQDGIKAAAATFAGGLGAGSEFDYFFEVPVKHIDLTFDKPYMFLVRDKDSGDIWFAGTVYEPLLYANDTTKEAN